MLHIVPYSEGASPALWMALRLLGYFSWDFETSMDQRNALKNVFPGPKDWHTGIGHTRSRHSKDEHAEGIDCEAADWPVVAGRVTSSMICAALPAWEGSPMWRGPFEFESSDAMVEFKTRKVLRPVHSPKQLPVAFRVLNEEGEGIDDVDTTPPRFTFLSIVSVVGFARVKWALRDAVVASEDSTQRSPTNFRRRPAGQDWLKETEGLDNPTVDHHWINGYRELLNYAVKLITSSTPSSFRDRRRPTPHLGFAAPPPPTRMSTAPRTLFWNAVDVGPRVKKDRTNSEDKSSSPLDTTVILERWLSVLTSRDEEEIVKTLELKQLGNEYGSAGAALQALTRDLDATAEFGCGGPSVARLCSGPRICATLQGTGAGVAGLQGLDLDAC